MGGLEVLVEGQRPSKEHGEAERRLDLGPGSGLLPHLGERVEERPGGSRLELLVPRVLPLTEDPGKSRGREGPIPQGLDQ